MFCVNCGETINEGELICKGCSNLSANLRDEILAASEKHKYEGTELKCPACGADVGPGYRYCNVCGKPVS